MNPNTLGAWRRWPFDFARSRLRQGKTVRSAAEEESRSEERGVGKGWHALSPPQRTVTRSATSAPVEPSSPGVRPRIDRSDDANAALVEVLAALKLSSSCVT